MTAAERTIVAISSMLRPGARSRCVAVAVAVLCLAVSGTAPASAASKPEQDEKAAKGEKAAKAKAAKAPAEWDEQIAPIAHDVEDIRGLSFEHPVAVEYLDDAKFRKRVTDDSDESEQDVADEQRAEAQLRAVGLIAADVDLGDATDAAAETGVLAYYDTETDKVTVRGKQLDAMMKVTLAHELTHALDDQHFDLDALDRAADKAHATTVLDALVEGNATRVEDEYVQRLPDDERDEYESGRSDTGASIEEEHDAADIPAAVDVFFGSPYFLGVQMVQVAAHDGGNESVDGLFGDPPRSELAFIDAGTVASTQVPFAVPPPPIEEGERRSGRRDSFGAFALYLMLSTAMNPAAAFDAVRGWGGDAMVTVKRGDETCVRANFTGQDADASAAITSALQQWSANGAHPSSTVTTAGPVTTLLTCDGDAPATDPAAPLNGAVGTLQLRNDLLLSGLHAGVERRVIECTANAVIRAPEFAAYRDDRVASPAADPATDVLERMQRAVQRSATDCRRQV